MKLDISHMRYLTNDDFRVLIAVELGSRNHEVVPTPMIHQIGGLRSPSTTNRSISDLAKLSLISKLRNAKYDGYRLSYLGFDYLALKSMLKKGSLYSMGSPIGVGKESDIYLVSDPKGVEKVLKVHRLGRTSFKTVKRNRDYLKNRQSCNWMYLSRLAAEKEYMFMSILYSNGFSVPEPFDSSRHCIIMEWIRGVTMRRLRTHKDYKKLYSELMRFAVSLANHGLIHCDFNEFNVIIRDDPKPDEPGFVVIDFPQCISIEHPDASFYFKRDIECIRKFFRKVFNYGPTSDPSMMDEDGFGEGFKYAYPVFERDVKRINNLDVLVEASGFKKNKKNSDLETAVQGMREYTYEEEEGEGSTEEESDYEDSPEFDDSESEGEQSDLAEENERIVQALTSGVENLKMDKLGNYILDD
ncbi:Serine kinase [Komagataella kurtzmanii]|nr:Serine kinase [Komagataella kurtzmanii]